LKILIAHNSYQQRGGEDSIVKGEAELLRSAGHEIIFYRRDNNELKECGLPGHLTAGLETIWAVRSSNEISRLIEREKPHVAHFHNTFPLISPSAYYACAKAGIPVIQTLHNYRLLCPNGLFFRDGRLCEDCLGKAIPWQAVAHRCYRHSAAVTTAVSTMLIVHRAIRTWRRRVDVFVALTEFAKQKFMAGGLPAKKIVVKPNFAFDSPSSNGDAKENYFLFVGRLSSEKGIETLLNAWKMVGDRLALKIVGTGPLAPPDGCRTAGTGIEFAGEHSPSEIVGLMERAQCLVFPSRVYEGMPKAIIEAFAVGLPVIASRLGAMVEIVEDGETGLHFEAGNAADLAAKVQWAWEHPEEMRRMGRAARAEFEARYTPERNYQMLMEIYDKARKMDRPRIREGVAREVAS
jgi:glycosyltransferase involved in cell wall biosynthesis